jgi:toxin ParE1/3/4
MATVVVSGRADADFAEISAKQVAEYGRPVAMKYGRAFESLLDRLADNPNSCVARPRLGRQIRICVVYPFLLVYRHVSSERRVEVLRVIYGRRRLTRKLINET